MKILHLMKSEKFTKGVALFYDKYFNNGEHEICYINATGEKSLIDADLKIKQHEVFFKKHDWGRIKNFLQTWKQYDYIVMHSLFFSNILLALNKKLLKKVVWIAWGYDLYNWPQNVKGIKAKLKKWGGERIRKECVGFVGIFPPDCDVFQKKYPKSKAQVFYAPYCSGEIPEEYFQYSSSCRLDETVDNGEAIYIQIGHSAVKSVNHMRVLDKIKHLSQENIKILLPLSYGDMEYGDMVQKYAEELFPKKVICLREMLPKEEYFKLINRVDIAIFETTRQIALGNINRMIFRNVKLYLSKDGVMYDYFLENGIPLQDTETLNNITIEELKERVRSHDILSFNNYIKGLSDLDQKICLWQNIYNKLKESI